MTFEVSERQEWVLSEEGSAIARDGSHEAKVFFAVPEEGISQSSLTVWNIFLFFLFFS